MDVLPTGEDRFYLSRDVRMTPERQRVRSAMSVHDEGLGPRAYACLLQLADGRQPHSVDVEWLTDGVESPSIARMGAGGCELTAYGRLLADAANRGDVEMMFALTTLPDLME